MGLYDREYLREEEARYGGFSPGQSVTIILIAINVAVFFANALFSGDTNALMEALQVSRESLLKPWLAWQLVTAGFAHDPATFNHIVFNMFALFIFGTEVERMLGKREFLRFYLVPLVLGNVAYAARKALLMEPGFALGASGAVMAVTLMFILLFPRRTLLLFFVLPMPAWLVGVIIIVWDVLGAFDPESHVAHDVHLVGAGFAFLYWRFRWNLGYVMPTEWIGNLWTWLRRPRLKVHRAEPDYRELDAQADRVLEKLHREGEASLTARERKILEDYSRRMRQKRS